MVLKGVKMVHGGLSTVCVKVLKEVKMVHGGYYPLCMSQMVLKADNSVCIHNGLEMSQFTMLVPNGLERSQHLFLPKVREGPHGVSASQLVDCCTQCM